MPARPVTCLVVGAVVCTLLLAAAPAIAVTYLVRSDGTGDFPDIQSAIMACNHGDIVELADGTYTGAGNRDLTNHETAVLIRSASGDATACIIDLEGSAAEPHRFISLVITGEKTREVWGLHDLTITGGYADYGGAVQVWDWARPEIHGCVFRDNTATGYGGAIMGSVGLPDIAGCWFEHNTAAVGGALGGTSESRFTVSGSTFVANTADEGGAVHSSYDLGSSFASCTFAFNEAEAGSALDLHQLQQTVVVTDCLLAFGAGGAAVVVDQDDEVVLTCCDIVGNAGGDWTGAIADQLGTAGNISEEPFFCAPDAGDYRLHEGSPCAPGTPPNPECGLIGSWPVGCEPVATEPAMLGSVRRRFR